MMMGSMYINIILITLMRRAIILIKMGMMRMVDIMMQIISTSFRIKSIMINLMLVLVSLECQGEENMEIGVMKNLTRGVRNLNITLVMN